jgi:hypothetical protein
MKFVIFVYSLHFSHLEKLNHTRMEK